MDIKIGTRTFLEDEVGFSPKQLESKKSVKATVCKPRRDLYEKMFKEDPEAPTTEETSDEAVSKYRCVSLLFQFRPEFLVSFSDTWTGETAFLPRELLDSGRPLNINTT